MSERLEHWLKNSSDQIRDVAVVGGSIEEPEWKIVERLFPQAKLTLFGVTEPFSSMNIEFDLNSVNENILKFDLVLCSQVLEHVWNHDQTFINLISLAKPGVGLIWVNCPASNMFHGSPDYFSAGFSSIFLEKNFLHRDCKIELVGQVGSPRNYFFTHALKYWATDREINHPILTFRPLRSYGRQIFFLSTRAFLGRIYSIFFRKEITNSPDVSTESYILVRVPWYH